MSDVIETTDLVQRIRERLNDAPLPTEYLLDEAADVIERLRLSLRLHAIRLDPSLTHDQITADIARIEAGA